MTQTEKWSEPDGLDSFPIIKLHCSSDTVSLGTELQVGLEVLREIEQEFQLVIALLSDRGQEFISLSVSSLQETVILSIPQDLPIGDYELQLVYQDWILDSTPIFVADTEFASQAALFEEGLQFRVQAMEAFRSGEYASAIALNNKATNYYIESGCFDIAADAWKLLGTDLLKANQLEAAQQAFEQAIKLFQTIKDLEGEAACLHLLNKTYELLLTNPEVIPDYIEAYNRNKSSQNLHRKYTALYQLRASQLEEAQQIFERAIKIYHKIEDSQREEDSLNSLGRIYEQWLSATNTVEIDDEDIRQNIQKCYYDFLGTGLTIKSRSARDEMLEICSRIPKYRYRTGLEIDQPFTTISSININLKRESKSVATQLRERLQGIVGKFSSYLLSELLFSFSDWLFSKGNLPAVSFQVESDSRKISFSIAPKISHQSSIRHLILSSPRRQQKKFFLSAIKAWSDDERNNLEYYSKIAKMAGADLSTQDSSIEDFVQLKISSETESLPENK